MSLPSGSSTRPFSNEGEIQPRRERAMLEHQEGHARSPPAQSRIESSTQPFSNSAEIQQRLARADAAYQESRAPGTRARPPLSEPTPRVEKRGGTQQGALVQPTPADLPISDVSRALAEASLASAPDARLVLAYRRWSDETGPAAFRLPYSVGGWDIVGVAQRTRDVDFLFCVPFYNPANDSPPWRHIPHRLRCLVYYDPASDNCLLVNQTTMDIGLAPVSPPGEESRLSRLQSQVVGPGMWRISVGGDGVIAKQHLADFLILRRQFSVTIHEALARSAASTKRVPSDGEDVAAKRRRVGDVTEIFLAPTAKAPLEIPLVDAPHAALASVPAATPARGIIRTQGTPLLDILDGELAVVRTTRSEDAQRIGLPFPGAPSSASGADGPADYELSRLERVAETRSASVFTGRHSALPEDVVAKVIKYEGTAGDLWRCAMAWKREKTFLERLRHRNIISLKAFDGRLFAIYVEPLPRSLARGQSPFGPSDARSILRDMSSALAYLTTQQVTHNDIKPGNIAYSPQRGAVLLDFGLAMSVDNTSLPGGTPWYIPPDLIDERKRGLPGDVWALGVTMLYVIGKIGLPERMTRAWPIHNVAEKGGDPYRLMVEWIASVFENRAMLDRSDMVETLVYQMLERDPSRRIPATRIAAALESPALSIPAMDSVGASPTNTESGNRAK